MKEINLEGTITIALTQVDLTVLIEAIEPDWKDSQLYSKLCKAQQRLSVRKVRVPAWQKGAADG